jgi:hypothetical protein
MSQVVCCFDYGKDGIGFLSSQMYTYIQESISQGTSMNKYFEGIGCLWFSF